MLFRSDASEDELTGIAEYVQQMLEELGSTYDANKVLHVAQRKAEHREDLLDESIELFAQHLPQTMLASILRSLEEILGTDDVSAEEEEFLAALVEAWQIDASEEEESDQDYSEDEEESEEEEFDQDYSEDEEESEEEESDQDYSEDEEESDDESWLAKRVAKALDDANISDAIGLWVAQIDSTVVLKYNPDAESVLEMAKEIALGVAGVTDVITQPNI